MSDKLPRNYQGKHERFSVASNSKGHRIHVAEAACMYLELYSTEQRDRLVETELYRNLMRHDGTKTYLVHSTTPDEVEDILQQGLRMVGFEDTPLLESTVVMLSGPDDPDQVANNAFNLVYLYASARRTAKVIFEIPKPTPDIRIGRTAFKGTYLNEADGVYVINRGPVNSPLYSPDRVLYEIPAGCVMGYIDLANDGTVWVSNANFEPAVDASHAAGGIATRSIMPSA